MVVADALKLIATIAPLDLAARQISLGIRNGAGKWDGLSAARLADETLFPVAAARGINGFATLPGSAHELLHYPLLNPYDAWDDWFRRAGVVAAVPRAGTLVRLPGPSIPSRRDYYLVYPEGQPLIESARLFIAWLHEQMRVA